MVSLKKKIRTKVQKSAFFEKIRTKIRTSGNTDSDSRFKFFVLKKKTLTLLLRNRGINYNK